MIFRRFLTIAPVCAMLAAGAACASDEAVLGAQAAFRAGDPDKLARHAAALQGQVLEPWADYWKLRLRIDDAKSADVQRFLSRHQGTYLADLLRGDWLKELGRRGDWLGFERELGPLAQDDLEVRCYAWSARLARGDGDAATEARAAWLRAARTARRPARSSPTSCSSPEPSISRAPGSACGCCCTTARSARRAARSATCRRASSPTSGCSRRRRSRRRSSSPSRRRTWTSAPRARCCCSP